MRQSITLLLTITALLVMNSPTLAGEQEQEESGQRQDSASSSDLLDEILEHFQFGSYGRVSAGSNLLGGTGRQVHLVTHPPRLLESSYAEIDFAYEQKLPSSPATFLTQITLALGDKMFHFNGDFAADLAIRNLYLEVRDALLPGLWIWAGSRMYRGDDIYLLDFWPLEEQNTVGAGAAYYFGDTNIRFHIGLNRLDDKFMTQHIVVPGEEFGTRQVLFMDRQRTIFTLHGEHMFSLADELRLKAIVYAEAHSLAPGSRRTEDDYEQKLPSDFGWMAGAETSLYGFGESSHLNLFAHYASGLAAYNELAVPVDFNKDKKTTGATEIQFGLSANYELHHEVGFLLGAYLRYFKDADPNVYDRDDLWETSIAFRPSWFVSKNFQLVGEANLQYFRPNGLAPETGNLEKPLAFEVGLMPTLSVAKGSYSRPQLRLIFAMTFLNDSALRTFAPDDPQREHGLRYYLGISVEWWFHSSRYQE